MPTLLECLRSVPPDTQLRDLSATRDRVATAAEHVSRVHRDEPDYEVRTHRFAGRDHIAIGVLGGPDIYREE